MTTREQTSQTGEIKFSIVKEIDKTNKNNVIYSATVDEINSLNNENVQSKFERISESDISRTTTHKDRDDTRNKRQEYT